MNPGLPWWSKRLGLVLLLWGARCDLWQLRRRMARPKEKDQVTLLRAVLSFSPWTQRCSCEDVHIFFRNAGRYMYTGTHVYIYLYVYVCVCVCVCVLSHFSCVRLCNPMDCSPPGSSLHGILQARMLEWVAISFSRENSRPRDQTRVSCTGRQVLYH